jgi:hypothetical protein
MLARGPIPSSPVREKERQRVKERKQGILKGKYHCTIDLL